MNDDLRCVVMDDIGNATHISHIPSIRDCQDNRKETNKMAIKFQVDIIGLGPSDRYTRRVDRRIQKMCKEIVNTKMLEMHPEADDVLFARLENKYGGNRFSKYRVGIERGSVRYDSKNSTWYGTFRVTSQKNKN